ncbi:MAG: hypothetical protein DHS80DRAFT_33198 [Piptocephalis tieghemiana]|nr:MAG: hypothetical protein DHS80DRAFT_33198 [Piptocephalis tieghemiana]
MRAYLAVAAGYSTGALIIVLPPLRLARHPLSRVSRLGEGLPNSRSGYHSPIESEVSKLPVIGRVTPGSQISLVIIDHDPFPARLLLTSYLSSYVSSLAI